MSWGDVPDGARQPLDSLFAPKTIAVIGAREKEGSVGRAVMVNLLRSPAGRTLYPINPARETVLGLPAYPALAALPAPVDLAIIAIPAAGVPDIINACAESGVKSAIILSAGFKEYGPEGAELEQRIFANARSKVRILGPNSLGLIRPPTDFNASFAREVPRKGSVAFLSQSAALCNAVLDWSLRENVGFSAFISVGSMLDVGWGDLITYLGDDPHTQSIVIYMETIGDARAFLSAAREVALTKPIIVLRAGRSKDAERASESHTGALAGSDAVIDAAFKRSGVVRIETILELFATAEVLAKQPRPLGPRLSIVTNAGGPGVIATDALNAGGGVLSPLSEEMRATLDGFLPEHWSQANPIDILGNAEPERYKRTLEIVAKNPQSDGLLVILTPQPTTDPVATAQEVVTLAKGSRKPVLCCWMGGVEIDAGKALLNQAGIPTFPYPDTAAQVFTHMWRYTDNLRALYETPVLPTGADDGGSGCERAEQIILAARAEGRVALTPPETGAVLAAYGIESTSGDTDGFEVLLGSAIDPYFGPVLFFGAGGHLTETFQDRSLGLPPLTTTLARRMMERTCIFRALRDGVRGRAPVDVAALEQLLVRFSYLVAEQPWIKRIDINPLSASHDGFTARATTITLFGPDVREADLPRLAIRPYPTQYMTHWIARNGTPVTIRPIRPEDEPLMVQFHQTLSDNSVYMRYFHIIGLSQRISHERLARICFIDYDRTQVLVAECHDPESDQPAIMGVGRLTRLHGTEDADFAILVSDLFQKRGLGSELLHQLIQIGIAEKMQRLVGDILPENRGMQAVARNLGFRLHYSLADGVTKVELDLPHPA